MSSLIGSFNDKQRPVETTGQRTISIMFLNNKNLTNVLCLQQFCEQLINVKFDSNHISKQLKMIMLRTQLRHKKYNQKEFSKFICLKSLDKLVYRSNL